MIDKEPLTKDKLCLRELQAFHESLDREKGFGTDMLRNVAYLSEEIGWSLAQNLWYFVKQAKSAVVQHHPTRFAISLTGAKRALDWQRRYWRCLNMASPTKELYRPNGA